MYTSDFDIFFNIKILKVSDKTLSFEFYMKIIVNLLKVFIDKKSK